MPLSLADVLSAQAGGGPVYEGGPDANVTLGGVLSALLSRGGSLAEQHAPFPVPGMIQMGRTAVGAAALPGDVYSGRTEADLANPEYTNRAADLAQFMIGTPGGSGGLGSGARTALEEAPSFTERMAQGKDIAMERANRGQMTGDYGMGTAKRTAPEAPKGSMEYSSDRLMSSLRDTQAQLAEYKNPQKPLLAPGESPEDFSLFSGGNKKAGGLLAAEKTAAGDQFVLPGAEKATDATMAQRAADAPLKPTVAQKPADFGLFGDESKQGSLFSGGNTAEAVGGPEKATQLFQGYGIPGIRYLDQGSRRPANLPQIEKELGIQQRLLEKYPTEKFHIDNVARLQKELADARGTTPTSNYVVFNPEIVDILKKYGLAGLTMGGVLTAAGQQPAPAQ